MSCVDSPEWRRTPDICLEFNFQSHYNKVIITCLIITKGVGVASLKVYCYSQLVVNQIKGEYVKKGEQMKKYLREANALAETFVDFRIEAISIVQ